MDEDQVRIQRLTDIEDEGIRDAIASAIGEWGIDEKYVAVAEVSFGKTGYDEAGDESGASPWQSRSWQSIEVRVGPLLLRGSVTHVEHEADGKATFWVEASLAPTTSA